MEIIAPKVPLPLPAGVKMRLDYVFKGPLQEMLQYLTPKEMVRMSKVNKRFYTLTLDDYLWRYKVEASFPFYVKNFSDNWLNCYRRSYNMTNKMYKEKFDWEMVTLRK